MPLTNLEKSQEVIKEGLRLLEQKEKLKHGEWGAWLRENYEKAHQTALNRMNVARRVLKGKLSIDEEGLERIQLDALHQLCCRSVPPEVLEKAIKLARSGMMVTPTIVRKLVEDQPVEELKNIPLWVDFTPPKFDSEDKLRDAIAEGLQTQGVNCEKEVTCSAGAADIVTDDEIYELKNNMDRNDLFKAIGQVLVYREALAEECGCDLKPAIIYDGIKPKTSGEQVGLGIIIDLTKKLGIEITSYHHMNFPQDRPEQTFLGFEPLASTCDDG